jgi:beta-mannosidase
LVSFKISEHQNIIAVKGSIIECNRNVQLPLMTACFLAVLSGCSDFQNSKEDDSYQEVILHEGWEFRQKGDTSWMPAKVPGDVMTDLMRQDKLDDPFQGTNERAAQWVEDQDWFYRSVFDLLQSEDLSTRPAQELVFKGIDTYAEIRLNGTMLLETDNMHRTYVLPIPEIIESPCTLEIALKSAVESGMKVMANQPRLIPTSNESRPLNERTSSVTRKSKYQFGWDWGPRLTSCAIWRPVVLRERSPLESDDIQLTLISLDDQEAIYEIDAPTAIQLGEISLYGPNNKRVIWHMTPWESDKCRLYIDSPALWWPRGMGNQPLYSLNWNGINNSFCVRFGVRDIQWNRTPDAWGTSFQCEVNGQPFFAKGANIIPPDYFPARSVTLEDELIASATEANMNMLRIWGGGVYPSESFLNSCDENGLLIWQDFMFACGMVRGDSAHQANVKFEAIDQLKKIRNHPCIGILCGNNESMHAWKNWGWAEAFELHGADSVETEKAYTTIFDSILPNAIDSLTDFTYWPSSPMMDPNQKDLADSGDEHAWRVWFDTLDFDYYSNHAGRFASEYGLQSLPSQKTLNEVGIKRWDDEALSFRQRSSMEWLQAGLDGWGMMRIYARRYTADPMLDVENSENGGTAALNRWIYLSQLTQAIGLREAIERHRNSRGKFAGSLYWQLDDVWPTVSWSTVDHAGRWKLAHHAVKHANADCRAIWNRSDSLQQSLQLHNQAPLGIEGSNLHVQWRNSIGEIQYEVSKTANMNPFETIELSFPSIPKESPIVSWEWTTSSGEIIDNGHVLLSKPSTIHWPKAHIDIAQFEDELIISSDSIAYGVRIQSTEDGRFSENGFLLLPGKENARKVKFFPSTKNSRSNSFWTEHLAEFQ